MTATVRGRVQGVGFRDWVRRHAHVGGLVGSATNLADGTVSVVAQGPRPECEKLLETLRGSGSPGAVSDVDARWVPVEDGLDGFVLG